jgi:hypothetical protein
MKPEAGETRAYLYEDSWSREVLRFSPFSGLKTENRPSLSGRFSCPVLGRARRQASPHILSLPGLFWTVDLSRELGL